MTRYLPQTVLAAIVGIALVLAASKLGRCAAHAQPAPIVLMDAGAAAGPAVAPAAPAAPALHDPTQDPGQFLSDLGAAKHVGWPVLVFLLAFGVLELAAFLGKNWAPTAWLGKGRTSILIGGGVAVVTAGYNVLAGGGTWISVGMAALSALLLYAHPAAADVAAGKAA